MNALAPQLPASDMRASAAGLPIAISRFATAFSTGPAMGTAQRMTWEAFGHLLLQRREGEKDGPNFVPATFKPEPDGRVRRITRNVLARTMIALDCETNKKTGEVPPAFTEAVASVTARGWAAALYTSHSHTAGAPRYRVVLPISEEIAPDLPAPEVVAEALGLLGVLDESKRGPASLFYLPSNAPGQADRHQAEVIEGHAIDAEWLRVEAGAMLAAREAERERQRAEAVEAAARRRQERIRQGHDPDASILEAVRDRLDLEAELIGHGYERKGEGRYLYPKSETGIPGVYVIRGSDGVERAYSHHAGDPLAPGNLPSWCRAKAVDAVDVLAILDHGGDLTAALRTLAERFSLNQRPKREEVPPPSGEGDYGKTTDTAQQEPDNTSAADAAAEQSPELCSLLSIDAWMQRDIPPPDRLLGDFLTTTARAFLVGRTGLGKTLLALAMAAGMTSGSGFLHWRSTRPARVLYLDGEMPAELIKVRARDAIRRLGGTKIPPGNLLIFGRDIEKDARALCKHLPPLAPLNTDAGLNFLTSLIDALGGIDLIIFDNVMSLIAGDQKDELAWSDTLPLVAGLTDRRIGQLWVDHTGHNSDRQYGSSTKAWRFDAVGIMTPVPDDQRERGEVAFTLSFDYPGKARRRTPDNWSEFDTCTIRLRDDVWTSTIAGHTARRKVAPKAELFHAALLSAITGGSRAELGSASRAEWVAMCTRRNLVEPIDAADTSRDRSRKLAQFRKIVSDLQTARWIGAEGDTFTDLTRAYGSTS